MEPSERKPILCLDFDGVLHNYASGWQGAHVIPDPPVEGALDFLWRAAEHFEVHIFSSRSHQEGGIDAMQVWLFESYHKPRRHSTKEIQHFVFHVVRWPTFKPSAQVTIDDRAITFEGEWPAIEDLLAFKPWNKR